MEKTKAEVEKEEEIIELVDVIDPVRDGLLKEKQDLTMELRRISANPNGTDKIKARAINRRLKEIETELAGAVSETPTDRKENKGGRIRFGTIAIAIALLLLILWAVWSVWISNRFEQTKMMLAKAQSELASFKESQAAPAPAAPQGVPEIAIVRKGEGIEHALIRQLINDPFTYGFEGDATPETVKKWAQKKAHQIATLAGYYDWKFGREVRVKKPDFVTYLLVVDSGGKMLIEEYTKDNEGNSKTEPESIQELAKDYGSTKFKADKPGGIQHQYEYLFTGG